jgi:hypothetical protein
LQQTKATAGVLNYLDSAAAGFDRRFYRTTARHLATPFPKPAGPFPVGITYRLMRDDSRRNRYFVSTNGSFMTDEALVHEAWLRLAGSGANQWWTHARAWLPVEIARNRQLPPGPKSCQAPGGLRLSSPPRPCNGRDFAERMRR